MKWYILVLSLLLAACSSQHTVVPEPVSPPVLVTPEPEHAEPQETKTIEWQSIGVGVVTCSMLRRQALVYYYSPHCPFCRAMERSWSDPAVAAFVVDSGWCTIRVNIEEEEFDDAMMVYGVPWVDVLNIVPIPSTNEGRLGFRFQRVAVLTGYHEPEKLLTHLRTVLEGSENMTHVRHTRSEGTAYAER